MKEDKNKLGIGEWIIVLVLASILLYIAHGSGHGSGYKSRMLSLIFRLLNSNIVTYWLLRGCLIFIGCFSLYKIVKIIKKK
ncbi:hypothetical protein [Zobellia galactanivorans]|uniref:Putative membrane protein n=1 Tax=Zobellia galactanivorans (strain DSM 12802 / CCUG 47099 / CIP 106680 / NCIMB 13871 / Dsij) TaxID=63186 RepID=G0LAN3_ZOBGA|nr:hypothetical protein [Zobellia galactanivorans]CAZ95452.1 Putative membrane protein [Zobellia galactanivorans]